MQTFTGQGMIREVRIGAFTNWMQQGTLSYLRSLGPGDTCGKCTLELHLRETPWFCWFYSVTEMLMERLQFIGSKWQLMVITSYITCFPLSITPSCLCFIPFWKRYQTNDIDTQQKKKIWLNLCFRLARSLVWMTGLAKESTRWKWLLELWRF